MSVARLDLERLYDFSKREIERTLETDIRNGLIKKYGAAKGSAIFNELVSEVYEALAIEPTRYRKVTEYIEALRGYVLGTLFLANLLKSKFMSEVDVDELVDIIKRFVQAIRLSAPSANAMLLVDSLKEIIREKLTPNEIKKTLLATVFDYVNTILKSISFKNLTHSEKELVKDMLLSLLDSWEEPVVSLNYLYNSLNISISYKEFKDMINNILEYTRDIVMIKGRKEIWLASKQKLDVIVDEIAEIVRNVGEIDLMNLKYRLRWDLPDDVLRALAEMVDRKYNDLMLKGKFPDIRILLKLKDPLEGLKIMIKSGRNTTRKSIEILS